MAPQHRHGDREQDGCASPTFGKSPGNGYRVDCQPGHSKPARLSKWEHDKQDEEAADQQIAGLQFPFIVAQHHRESNKTSNPNDGADIKGAQKCIAQTDVSHALDNRREQSVCAPYDKKGGEELTLRHGSFQILAGCTAPSKFFIHVRPPLCRRRDGACVSLVLEKNDALANDTSAKGENLLWQTRGSMRPGCTTPPHQWRS